MKSNPYAPPQSDVSGGNALHPGQVPNEKPGAVWIIFIFYCVGAIGMLVALPFTLSGRLPVPNEIYRLYFESLNWFDHTIMISGGALGWWAALQLFRLRKIAVPLFWVVLGISIFHVTYQLLANPYWLKAMMLNGQYGWLSVGSGWLIKIAVTVYAWRLSKRGVLL